MILQFNEKEDNRMSLNYTKQDQNDGDDLDSADEND